MSGLWQSQPIAEYCSLYRKTVLHCVYKMKNNDFSKFCLHYSKRCGNIILLRGRSSAGRALEWHSRGQRFDPVRLHHIIKQGHTKSVSLFYNLSLVVADGIEGDRARNRNAKSFLLRVKMILWIIFRESVDRACGRSTPLRRRGRGSPKDRAKSVFFNTPKVCPCFITKSRSIKKRRKSYGSRLDRHKE